MSKKRTVIAVGVAGLTAGLVLGPVQSALAGHTNPLTTAHLDGRAEVAPDGSRRLAGDPNGLGEAYVFPIDNTKEMDGQGGFTTTDNSDTLCYVLTVDKVSGTENNPGAPYAAHIHRGAPGSNGPVVVNLAFPTGGEAADCVTETRVTGPSDTPVFARDANGALLATAAEIRDFPERFYVNVHNAEHPTGAVRGQLHGH